MRAIMVMFDSLNRRLLPGYGGMRAEAPNFERLRSRVATFDNCYAGSMPCIPARREMHTARYNFLHRSWGPLEPFDDSVPELLTRAGVYTHLVTDHKHYWGSGGATYHTRYRSFEFFRGQEGDAWKGVVSDPSIPESGDGIDPEVWRQDRVNRRYLEDEAQHPQTLTFDAGEEFVRRNVDAQDWFLQVESYDPHEPFFTYEHYRQLYETDYSGRHQDWPSYRKVTESVAEAEHLRNQYFALLSMCDRSLGRVLDLMDELELWDDTMLIVCTDHGLLLGEHGWWGKGVQPWYDENIHTPLFIWDPRSRVEGERRSALVQTIDFGPTLLDLFGVEPTPDMQGVALGATIAAGAEVREGALFGSAGGHVNVTDGRYVYMRASGDESNSPLFNYTLMPMHLGAPFSVEELAQAELVEPFSFTKGVRVLRTPATSFGNPFHFGTLLFDLQADPDQRTPLLDDETELRMVELLVELMRANDAPAEQYLRLGLPVSGRVGVEHLLCRTQRSQVERALAAPPRAEDFAPDAIVATRSILELLDDGEARALLVERYPILEHHQARAVLGGMSLVRAAARIPVITRESLARLEVELGALPIESTA